MNCWKQKEEYPNGYQFKFNSNIPNYQINFPDNSIRSTKYTLLSFFPLAFLYQFKRLANVYFLFVAILQSFPILSPFAAYTAWSPLAVVIGISLLR